jgi:Lecithin retinol acyltransferase
MRQLCHACNVDALSIGLGSYPIKEGMQMTSQSLVTSFSRAPAHQYGVHGDAEIATHRSLLRGGLRQSDRRLAEGEEPALGSHLLSPRLGFAHHGIYVGCGRVVHYGALAHGLHRGPVEEVSLARFTHGHTLWVRPGAARFGCEEVIRRARSRIGENSYRLLSNNCEHFCEWCLRGEHRSEQVERALVLPRRFAHGISAAAVAFLAVSAISSLWS